jgi:hypothetical protein
VQKVSEIAKEAAKSSEKLWPEATSDTFHDLCLRIEAQALG